MAKHLARKRFGQHFLTDINIIEAIVDAIDPRQGDALVEIGPGLGAMTLPLLKRIKPFSVIELDRDLAARLRQREGLDVIESDVLRVDFAALALAKGKKLRVVGNLPYNISTPLMFHLLETPGAIHDLHIMLQKEVIDRICAAPGSDDYGRLTVMLAPWVQAEHLFDVGPDAFRPAPRVWSAVARLTVREAPAFAVDDRYGRVVAAAFSQRRKTLRNGLRTLLDAEAIAACGIDPGARPEVLAPAAFAALALCLPPTSSVGGE